MRHLTDAPGRLRTYDPIDTRAAAEERLAASREATPAALRIATGRVPRWRIARVWETG